MSTAYVVEGLSCGYCVAEVLENVNSPPGVTAVADLVTGGQPPLIVTSVTNLGADEVRDVVENAGFGFRVPREERCADAGTARQGRRHPSGS